MSLFDRVVLYREEAVAVRYRRKLSPEETKALAQLRQTRKLPPGFQMVFGVPRMIGRLQPRRPTQKPSGHGKESAAPKAPATSAAQEKMNVGTASLNTIYDYAKEIVAKGKGKVAPGSKAAKRLIGLGLPKHDKGDPNDDSVKAELGHTAAKDLKPLQNEIFVKKIVGNLVNFGIPEQGGRLTDEAPIIVSEDGYILDGHHRFGQAMLADPNLKMKSLTVPLKLDKLLKLTRTYGTAIGNRAKGDANA